MMNPDNEEQNSEAESLDVELNTDDLDAISGGLATDGTCYSSYTSNTTASTCFTHYSEKRA